MLVLVVWMALILLTNLSYSVFLTKSVFTKSLSLLKSIGTGAYQKQYHRIFINCWVSFCLVLYKCILFSDTAEKAKGFFSVRISQLVQSVFVISCRSVYIYNLKLNIHAFVLFTVWETEERLLQQWNRQ